MQEKYKKLTKTKTKTEKKTNGNQMRSDFDHSQVNGISQFNKTEEFLVRKVDEIQSLSFISDDFGLGFWESLAATNSIRASC